MHEAHSLFQHGRVCSLGNSKIYIDCTNIYLHITSNKGGIPYIPFGDHLTPSPLFFFIKNMEKEMFYYALVLILG